MLSSNGVYVQFADQLSFLKEVHLFPFHYGHYNSLLRIRLSSDNMSTEKYVYKERVKGVDPDQCIPACIWHSEDRIPVLNSLSNDTIDHGLLNEYCSITHNNALLLNEGGANAIGFYLNEAISTVY